MVSLRSIRQLFPFLHDDNDLSLDGIYEKANGLVKKNKFREAFLLYLQAAEQGHVKAECKVGLCYRKHLGVAYDIDEAVRWVRLSAVHGYAAAQYHLGTYYHRGLGVHKDIREALEWYARRLTKGTLLPSTTWA